MPAAIKSDAGPERRRGRPSTKADKRAKLIEGATDIFNARGISATSIVDIAESIGLARATAYYYVKDRTELVRLCYHRACQIMADDIAAAAERKTGLDRLLAFISLSLTPDRAPVAVLSEIHSLPAEIAEEIHTLHVQNVADLVAFFETGRRDGSIGVHDTVLAAQSIIGMLSWTQLLPQWSDRMQREALRSRAAASMQDLILYGVSRDPGLTFSCPINADRYLPRLDDIFDRQQATQLKLERLLATASKLFNRNGIEATSLDEIGGALGLTKGVIYHYFEDKPDLVRQCYARSFALYGRFVEDAITAGRNGLERALINAHLNAQAQAGTVSPLMPQPGFEALPEELRKELHGRARAQNRAVADLLDNGIREGLARECDAGLVTHLVAGAFGWIPKWLQPEDDRSPREIADAICQIILSGVATPEGAAAHSRSTTSSS